MLELKVIIKNLLDKYRRIIQYIEVIYPYKTYISYSEYCEFLEDLHGLKKKLLEEIRLKTVLLDRYRGYQNSPHMYTCAHGGRNNRLDISLAVQISRHMLVLRTLPMLERDARIMSTLYRTIIAYNEVYDEATDLLLWIRSIDPCFVDTELDDLIMQFRNFYPDVSRMCEISHDANNYFIIMVTFDGQIEYDYYYQ